MRRWLDAERFPGRRHLAAIARDHRPASGGGNYAGALAEQVRDRWAAAIGCAPEALVLCASVAEAARLCCAAFLRPTDTALLARPSSVTWPAAVLGAGAAFVDLGRLADGAVDPAGARFAAEAHPGALWLLDAPSLSGADDCADLWSTLEAAHRSDDGATVVIDASRELAYVGAGGARVAPCSATLLALRDPLAPQAALLCAVRVGPEDFGGPAALLGPAQLPAPLLELALAALQRAEHADPAALADQAAALSEAVTAALTTAVGAHPGVARLGGLGLHVALRCDGGDAVAVAKLLGRHGLCADAYGGGAMRDLVLVARP